MKTVTALRGIDSIMRWWVLPWISTIAGVYIFFIGFLVVIHPWLELKIPFFHKQANNVIDMANGGLAATLGLAAVLIIIGFHSFFQGYKKIRET